MGTVTLLLVATAVRPALGRHWRGRHAHAGLALELNRELAAEFDRSRTPDGSGRE